MSERLHPDFPETPQVSDDSGTWNLPAPFPDLVYALEVASGSSSPSLSDLATVEAYHVAWEGAKWGGAPDEGGTELELVMLGTLKDGDWFALEAWNDYTGWGCQDGSDLYVGPTREDVIANGLTQEGRASLGIERVS